eukprot:768106-Hanusia_phi.AAC.2
MNTFLVYNPAMSHSAAMGIRGGGDRCDRLENGPKTNKEGVAPTRRHDVNLEDLLHSKLSSIRKRGQDVKKISHEKRDLIQGEIKKYGADIDFMNASFSRMMQIPLFKSDETVVQKIETLKKTIQSLRRLARSRVDGNGTDVEQNIHEMVDLFAAARSDHHMEVENSEDFQEETNRMLDIFEYARQREVNVSKIKPSPDQIHFWRAVFASDSPTVLSFMRSRKVDADLPDPSHDLHSCAIHVAVQCNDTAMVALLLKHGASPHVLDKNLETPLHCASRFCHSEIAKMLMLEYSLSPSQQNQCGQNSLHLLLDWTEEARDQEALERNVSQLELTLHYLTAGVDPNAVDHRKWTPLHYAGLVTGTVILLLLQAGASVNPLTANGHTPLDWAYEAWSRRSVPVLEQAGAVRTLRGSQSVWEKHCVPGFVKEFGTPAAAKRNSFAPSFAAPCDMQGMELNYAEEQSSSHEEIDREFLEDLSLSELRSNLSSLDESHDWSSEQQGSEIVDG